MILSNDENQVQDITPKNFIDLQIPKAELLEKRLFEE